MSSLALGPITTLSDSEPEPETRGGLQLV